MKVLNLYAGIGGNRELWPSQAKVTAVEINPRRAAQYAERFPQDTVIVADAHQFLLEHFKEYDFIWSSPPCPTHSRTNYFIAGKGIHRYPDMRLYQEIILLQHQFKGVWCVENVISYYNPLISPQKVGRHYLWANFRIPPVRLPKDDVGGMNGKWQSGRYKTQEERDAVHPKLGLHVWRCAMREVQEVLV